jgi:hypothetical protein
VALPAADERLLDWMSVFGFTYSTAGRYASAIDIREQVLEAYEAAWGEEHPKMLTSRSNLAASYADTGRLGRS